LQDPSHLGQHSPPPQLQDGLPRIEEDLIHHVDAQLVLKPLHPNLPSFDLLLQLVHELILRGANIGQLGLLVSDRRFELRAGVAQLVQHLRELRDPTLERSVLLLAELGLRPGDLQRLLLGLVEQRVEGTQGGTDDQDDPQQPLEHDDLLPSATSLLLSRVWIKLDRRSRPPEPRGPKGLAEALQ